ncbi:MAG: DUF2059 domain-containing protein [Edaphobacter sp.]
MKRIALLLAFALCLPLTAHADEASRRVKAQEMINLMHLDRLMEQMMDTMMQQASALRNQLAGSNVNPQDQARLDEFQQKAVELIKSQMGWQALEPDYVDIYAKNFTDEQLDAILVFYKSPAGIALVDKLPTLTAEGAQLAQAKIVALQPQLRQLIEEYSKSVTTHGATPK